MNGLAATLPTPALTGLLYLMVFLVAAATALWLLYGRLGPLLPRNDAMPYLEHLEELRRRLLRLSLILLLFTSAFLTLRAQPFSWGSFTLYYPQPALYDSAAAQVYAWIASNALPPGVQIIVSTPTEAVAAQMGLALLLGLLVALPALAFEAWAFVSPGLGSREQRFLLRSLPAALLLFLSGTAFAYLLVVPLIFRVLYAFAQPLGAVAFLSAGSLVGTVATFCILFGLAFQLPLVMVALVRVGLTTPHAYLRRWRHATITIFIVAALATDPTIVSQLLIGSILLGLYWGGVLASFWATPTVPIVRPTRYGKAT